MSAIPALTPRGAGHQFVVYADACSGVAGAPHEATTAAVNKVVAALEPPPEFICFPGDEIIGLTANEALLRAQWDYWFQEEMGWLDQTRIPLYHTSGNHTTYNEMSEAVFRDVMRHLPQNGPSGQEGLTYYVRDGDLLLVFVHTLWSGAGGEGFMELDWLAATLAEHREARYTFIFGHHPIFPVNGFAGPLQREVDTALGQQFWSLLVANGVAAYFCSHILAFDVQVHQGVLQILTAGAGTAHRMPPDLEYLHCVQAAVDEAGLRYQVIDTEGEVREWLSWPLQLPPAASWPPFTGLTPMATRSPAPTDELVVLAIKGTMPADGSGQPQTILCGQTEGDALPALWLGLKGADNRLVVTLSPAKGRSPHLWFGPSLPAKAQLALQVGLHKGMGPGGILWRWDDDSPWQSFQGASPWGLERLRWPEHWFIGQGPAGSSDDPFRGRNLQINYHHTFLQLTF